MKENQIVLPPDAKEKGVRIIPPQGCEVEKIETVDGVAVVIFKAKERQLPKSWEEFCEMYPTKANECYIDGLSEIGHSVTGRARRIERDENLLPDRATAEAVLALCQLIQLRNTYNGDWVPDWNNQSDKYIIAFYYGDIETWVTQNTASVLNFNTKELRDEFLHNFRDLIEKIKPLYGIKEGGEE